MSDLFTPDEVVYAYTRRQAVEDGDQVLLSGELGALAAEAGYKYPVYLTHTVITLIETAVGNKKQGNDWNGVLWDILWMSRRAGRAWMNKPPASPS